MVVGERSSWRVIGRELRHRLSAELIVAARERSFATELAQGTAGALAEMRAAAAVSLKDDASIIALDECQGDVGRQARASGV
jgi:hypothetical protein